MLMGSGVAGRGPTVGEVPCPEGSAVRERSGPRCDFAVRREVETSRLAATTVPRSATSDGAAARLNLPSDGHEMPICDTLMILQESLNGVRIRSDEAIGETRRASTSRRFDALGLCRDNRLWPVP